MVDTEIKELKWNYNYTLNRYYNGVNYCEQHPNLVDKYIPAVMEIKKDMETFLKEIMKTENVTDEEILNGFKM